MDLKEKANVFSRSKSVKHNLETFRKSKLEGHQQQARFRNLPLPSLCRQQCSSQGDLKCNMYQILKWATGKEENLLFYICCSNEVLGSNLYEGTTQLPQKGAILMSSVIFIFFSSIWFKSVYFSKFSVFPDTISMAGVSLQINPNNYRW